MNHMICPSCGTQFGYDDATLTHAELREEWIGLGAPWVSRVTPKPVYWNATQQLADAGFNVETGGEKPSSEPTKPSRWGRLQFLLQRQSVTYGR